MTTTLTNIAKNRKVAGTGGQVVFGWLFLFTRTTPATGPSLTNIPRNPTTLINVSKS